MMREDIEREIERVLLSESGHSLAMTEQSLRLLEDAVNKIINSAIVLGEIGPDEMRPLAILLKSSRSVRIVDRPRSDEEARLLWMGLQLNLSEVDQRDAINSLCARLPEFFSNNTPWFL